MSIPYSDDKVERVAVHIDSADRTSGSNENFEIKLSNEVTRVKSVEVVSVEIPFTFYTLNSSNNVFKFTDNTPTTYTVTLSPGNYDGATFASALQTAMNLLMAGFTVTYGYTTFKLTWANASQFNILISGSTMASTIGVTSASGLTTSFTSQGTINLSGPNYILIKSDKLVKPKRTPPYLHSAQANVLYKVVVSTGPGSTLIEKNSYSNPNPIMYGTRQRIQVIDLQLIDPNGNVLDLNGQRWSMTILLDIV